MVVGCCVSPQGPFIFGDHSDKVILITVKETKPKIFQARPCGEQEGLNC